MHLLYKHGPLKLQKSTQLISNTIKLYYIMITEMIYAVRHEMSENLKNTDNRVGEELLHNKVKERVGCLTIQDH